MESLDFDSLEALSADDLRGLIVRLAAELSALRATVSGLEGRIGGLEDENTTLREQAAALTAENRTLKDEVARLKELPRRPPDKPSGMEQSTEAGQIAREEVALPAAARRNVAADRDHAGGRAAGGGACGIAVQGLRRHRRAGPRLAARATRYRRERWTTPSGETVSGALPAGIVGGFGPDLQRFILALHIQGQVTTERLTTLLNGMGVVISKRQVVRLLAKCAQKFEAEEAQVLRAGLSTRPGSRSMTRRRGMRDATDTRRRSAMTASRRSVPARPSRGRTFCRSCARGRASTSSTPPPSTICVGAACRKQRSRRLSAPDRRNSPMRRLLRASGGARPCRPSRDARSHRLGDRGRVVGRDPSSWGC